jgi:ribosomal protein L28
MQFNLVEDLSPDTSIAVKRVFAPNLIHFRFVSSNPDRPAIFELTRVR